MAKTSRELSDRELFFGHLVELLDESLPAAVRDRVVKYAEGHKTVPEDYQHTRGRLQLALQSIYLNEDETLELRGMVRTQEERQTIDEARISEVGRREFWSHVRRQLSFFSMTIAIIFIFFHVFSPKKKERFDALQALAYEAMAFEEDKTPNLDLPTGRADEVREFFEQNQKFAVKPVAFASVPPGWQLEGVSVIEYDVAFVGMVQYRNEQLGEMMFHFSFEGTLDDFPKSEEGNVDGFKYRAYASDRLNIIAWQQAEGLISFLVGHRAANELAKIAGDGLRK